MKKATGKITKNQNDKIKKTGKWLRFLKIRPDGWSSLDPVVDKTLKNLSRNGKRESSRALYMRQLYRLCVFSDNIPPAELIKKDKQWLENKIEEFCDQHQESRNYVNTLRNVFKKIFKDNGLLLNIAKYRVPRRWRKRPEYIPTLREAIKMAQVAKSLRDRCIIYFFIYCGLRNATLRALRISENYPDTPIFNNYTIKKELERNLDCLAVIIHPAMRRLIPDACKNDIIYFVFVPRRVIEALGDYLHERKLKWGPIKDEEPLFILERQYETKKEPFEQIISEAAILDAIKSAARLANVKEWESVTALSLRKVFNNFLIKQENRPLEEEEREFFMGHLIPGSRDSYFDKTKIEDMRQKYLRLDFDPKSISKRIKKIISEDQLDEYLNKGGEFIAILPSGKILIECEGELLKKS